MISEKDMPSGMPPADTGADPDELHREQLRSRIDQEGRVQSAKAAREVLNLLVPEREAQGSEFSHEEALSELMEGRSTGRERRLIASIESWVTHAPDGNAMKRIAEIEREVGAAAERGDAKGSLSLLAMFGGLERYRTAVGVEEDMATILERTGALLSNDTIDQLAVLNRLNDPQGNLLLHEILDFIESDLWTLQNIQEEETDLYGNSYANFSVRIAQSAAAEAKNAKNYLLRRHLENLHEMLMLASHREKPGSLPGVAGGSSDTTIYTFRHIKEAHDLRIATGIREGYPIAHPVLPIAPGLLGLYRGGRLAEVFAAPREDWRAEAQRRKAEYIARNDPRDDHIYDVLNEPLDLSGRFRDASNSLRKLQDIWDFEARLDREGRKFFYDTDRLRVEELHPMVLGDLLTRNEAYLKSVEGEENDIAPLSATEYERRVFPEGPSSGEEAYAHRYLMSLQVRKEIEDDLQINLAEVPLRSQVHFLRFLADQGEAGFARIKGALEKHRGQETLVLTAFLANAEDAKYAEAILAIAEQFPPEGTGAILAKYKEITDLSDAAGAYIGAHLKDGASYGEKESRAIVRHLLHRANEFLVSIRREAREDEAGIVSRLQAIKADIALFASAFKAASESKGISLAEVQGAEFSLCRGREIGARDKEEMLRIFRANRPQYPGKLLKETVDEFEEALQDPANEFYVLRLRGEIVGFIRFEKLPDGSWYTGSLNVRPEAQDSAIGSAILKAKLEEKSRESDIHAVAYSKNPMLKHYLSDFKFENTGEIPDYHGTGELFYGLLRRRGT